MAIFEWNKCKKRWPYLRDIDFPRSTKRQIVDVLIGLDCADLHCAIEEVRGKPGEPIARLMPLGWTCIGNPGKNHCSILQTNFACTYFVRDQSALDRLNENLKRFWEIDEVHTAHETPVIRLEEQLALRTAENSLTYENQMYRVGIPWKESRPVLPDNYDMAVRRLENTEKRLKRSSDIAGAYNQCIEQYVEKGYIRKIPEHEKCKSKWYLPHFPVIRLDKETTKTRIVFGASAKYEGVSLNDIVHQGPKLQRNLFDVLMRFRRFPIALVCDIAEIYLRIGIAHEDKPYHRFLWRGTNQNRRTDIYEFDRVVFGLNSSPFQAQYVVQEHAKKYQQDFPMAVETVLKSTYMDDSMDSARDEDQAIDLYKQLSNLLTKKKKVREKSRECHNHKPQPFPDPKRKRKPTNPNKQKSNKRTKSTEISSLFPKRGNRNTKRTEKHKNKMTHGKTYNKSPRRINHKATKSKTNTGTTALERSVE